MKLVGSILLLSLVFASGVSGLWLNFDNEHFHPRAIVPTDEDIPDIEQSEYELLDAPLIGQIRGYLIVRPPIQNLVQRTNLEHYSGPDAWTQAPIYSQHDPNRFVLHADATQCAQPHLIPFEPQQWQGGDLVVAFRHHSKGNSPGGRIEFLDDQLTVLNTIVVPPQTWVVDSVVDQTPINLVHPRCGQHGVPRRSAWAGAQLGDLYHGPDATLTIQGSILIQNGIPDQLSHREMPQGVMGSGYEIGYDRRILGTLEFLELRNAPNDNKIVTYTGLITETWGDAYSISRQVSVQVLVDNTGTMIHVYPDAPTTLDDLLVESQGIRFSDLQTVDTNTGTTPYHFRGEVVDGNNRAHSNLTMQFTASSNAYRGDGYTYCRAIEWNPAASHIRVQEFSKEPYFGGCTVTDATDARIFITIENLVSTPGNQYKGYQKFINGTFIRGQPIDKGIYEYKGFIDLEVFEDYADPSNNLVLQQGVASRQYTKPVTLEWDTHIQEWTSDSIQRLKSQLHCDSCPTFTQAVQQTGSTQSRNGNIYTVFEGSGFRINNGVGVGRLRIRDIHTGIPEIHIQQGYMAKRPKQDKPGPLDAYTCVIRTPFESGSIMQLVGSDGEQDYVLHTWNANTNDPLHRGNYEYPGVNVRDPTMLLGLYGDLTTMRCRVIEHQGVIIDSNPLELSPYYHTPHWPQATTILFVRNFGQRQPGGMDTQGVEHFNDVLNVWRSLGRFGMSYHYIISLRPLPEHAFSHNLTSTEVLIANPDCHDITSDDIILFQWIYGREVFFPAAHSSLPAPVPSATRRMTILDSRTPMQIMINNTIRSLDIGFPFPFGVGQNAITRVHLPTVLEWDDEHRKYMIPILFDALNTPISDTGDDMPQRETPSWEGLLIAPYRINLLRLTDIERQQLYQRIVDDSIPLNLPIINRALTDGVNKAIFDSPFILDLYRELARTREMPGRAYDYLDVKVNIDRLELTVNRTGELRHVLHPQRAFWRDWRDGNIIRRSLEVSVNISVILPPPDARMCAEKLESLLMEGHQ